MTTLNVIYTPGTVVPFSRFAQSLLRWSDCRIRLVANGCTAAEQAHLQALAGGRPRMAFLPMPGDTPLAHGQVLNDLHERCDEPIFAFVDSDVFAVGPFMPDSLDAPLTCLLPPAAFWTEAEEARQRRRHALGCTYFALYDNESLRRVRRRYGVGFDKYRWDDLPGAWRMQLQAEGHTRPRFDTGKVLNILLASECGPAAFADPGNLRHLGGASRSTMLRAWTWRLWFRRLRADWRGALRSRRLRRAKQETNAYFAALFDALAQGGLPPDLPPGDAYVRRKVAAMTTEIVRMYAAAG